MNNFHHIGFFVKNIKNGYKELSKIIKIKKTGNLIIDNDLLVKILFVVDNNGNRFELVAPNGKGNPVDEVLKEKKNILNHIAYTCDKFDLEVLNLRNQGCIPISSPKKSKAFKGARVIFFLTPVGFIYELIEKE
jgi:methylmalonyl-CoA/ethylmalonyl-CoA epimerase